MHDLPPLNLYEYSVVLSIYTVFWWAARGILAAWSFFLKKSHENPTRALWIS